VSVHSPSRQQLRHLSDILHLLEKSHLPSDISEKAGHIFTLLARAEAKVHNMDIEAVHFHEVGAVDTIVDVVGSLIGLHHLGVKHIVCSPLPMGSGFVHCDHGKLPLPAPAVCELLKDVPVYGVKQEKELVTPTGAALARGLAESFGPMPNMSIKATGYGGGSNRLDGEQPNILRLVLGEELVEEKGMVEIIETNLDDWNTEGFPYLCDLLFAKGALDVSLSPLIMKKGRPGQLLRVIGDPAHSLQLKEIILSETSSIGLRFRREERITLQREAVLVDTPWGEIVAKKVQTPKGVVIYPEYEPCRKVAEREKIPLARVYQAVGKN
ncbi:MAG: nickel pincer cofactor biosynthesis protein LarC, partial [Thermodesulfobacteriota bacterium]